MIFIRRDPHFELDFEIQWDERSSSFPIPGQHPKVLPYLRMTATNKRRVMAEDFNCFVQIPAEVSGAPDEYRVTIEIDGALYVSEFFRTGETMACP